MTVATGESAQYVQFTENNDWEGETWHFYIPVEGNEEALEKLLQIVDGQPEQEPMPFELTKERLTGEQVDTLVRFGNDDNTSYASQHTKLEGRLDLDGVDDPKDLYKGEIKDCMRS